MLRSDSIVPNTQKLYFGAPATQTAGSMAEEVLPQSWVVNLFQTVLAFLNFVFIYWHYFPTRFICFVDKVTDYTRQCFEFPAGEG